MLETSRVRLRRFQMSDLNNMIELESDPDIMRFTPSLVPQTKDQTESKLKAQIEKESFHAPLGVWAAETRDTHNFIGWFMLLKGRFEWPELGFMIVRRQWNKGYATEIGERLIRYGFDELHHPKIVATTTKDNFTSKRVLEKLGFEGPETIKAFNPKIGHEIELDFFEILRKL